MKPAYIGNKYESTPTNIGPTHNPNLEISRMPNMSVMHEPSMLGASTLQINMNPDYEEKKDEHMLQGPIDTN